MTLWYRALFLFSSFGPLYFLLCAGLAVQHDWTKEGWKGGDVIATLCVGILFLLSFVIFLFLRSGFKSNSISRYSVDEISSLDEAILTYLIAYLPPLMIDDLSSIAKVVPLAIFYLIMTTVMLLSDTMYVNPYFLLFGYRVYRVKLPSNRMVIVVSRKRELLPGELLHLYEVQPSRLFYADEK